MAICWSSHSSRNCQVQWTGFYFPIHDWLSVKHRTPKNARIRHTSLVFKPENKKDLLWCDHISSKGYNFKELLRAQQTLVDPRVLSMAHIVQILNCLAQRVLNDLYSTKLSCGRIFMLFAHLSYPPPSLSGNKCPLFLSLHVSLVELTDGRGGRGWSHVMRPRESRPSIFMKYFLWVGQPVLLNVYGAPELMPRNEFRQPM